MLQMKLNCEKCNHSLPPNSDQAFVCSYECTYCETCFEELSGVCPNCKGNLEKRPKRKT
ncbi:MAG: DUF1272 domain-containing protein [Flavobacteriaceae bacterium]|nr:MAG: DUF1272 domain-containing protein [Flavobacteriaceae bacterium]